MQNESWIHDIFFQIQHNQSFIQLPLIQIAMIFFQMDQD